jgi:hypothetical protein
VSAPVRPILALAWLSACSPAAPLFLEAPWPFGRAAVLVWLDDGGRPIGRPIFLSADFQKVSAPLPPASGPVRAVVFPFRSVADRGPDLDNCGAAIGGPYTALTPTVSFSTELAPIRAGAVLVPTRDKSPLLLDLRFAKSCSLPNVCAGARAKLFAVTTLLSSQVPDLPEALTPSGTLVLGGYQLGPPGHGQVLIQDTQGNFNAIEVEGLRGRILDVAYDHQGSVVGTTTTGRLFAVDALGHPIPTASSAFSSQPVGISAGVDGTVIAYSSSIAVRLLRSGARALISGAPPGITALAVRTSTEIAAIAANPVDQVPALYFFDGQSWIRSYDGPELQPESGHPLPRPIPGRGRWAVIGPNGITIRVGSGRWRSEVYPFPPHQPLTGAFLPDGTLLVAGTFGTSGALGSDGTWCNSLAIGEPIWITHTEVSVDGTFAVFSTQQGFGATPTVIRVELF